jgi:hypothetical protein
VIDYEIGALFSATFLGGSLAGGVISTLMRKAGTAAVLAYRVDKIEADLNGMGRKWREELAAVETRLRGDLGRLQLQIKR